MERTVGVSTVISVFHTVNEKWNVDETDQDTRYEEAVSQLRSSNALPINTKLTERRVSVFKRHLADILLRFTRVGATSLADHTQVSVELLEL